MKLYMFDILWNLPSFPGMNYTRISPALLLLLAPFVAFGSAAELSLNKTETGKITPGVPVSYAVTVDTQDYAAFSVSLKDSPADVCIYDGAGIKLRGTRAMNTTSICFVAPAAGSYQIELRAAKASDFSITWSDRYSLDQRLNLGEGPRTPDSPAIRALQAALASGAPNAVPAFWEDVKSKGVPLIEPLEQRSKYALVTFLWKGDATTKRVQLIWRALNQTAPDKCRFCRVAGTNVWFATIKVKRTKRVRYWLVENGPNLPSDDNPERSKISDMLGINALCQIDPLNPKRVEVPEDWPDTDLHLGGSLLEMPDAEPEPWIIPHKDVPSGKVTSCTIRSDLLGDERPAMVYTPPGYRPDGKPYAVAFFSDALGYVQDQFVPTVLDNLLAEHRIPPLVAVMVDNAPDARVRELMGDPDFVDFLARELVPWAHQRYNITSDPRRVLIVGVSAGGFAAINAGYRHPEVFGNVLSQSGAVAAVPIQFRPKDPDVSLEPGWLARQYLASRRLPVRFFLSCGSDEINTSGNGRDILLSNRNLRDVLRAKGYEVFYKEVDGEHDALNFRVTLPIGLIELTRDMK
jgi:enterochelin esterase-like enzyme